MENLIHIIIIEDNLNDAEKIISNIKSGGWAVRAKRAEDEEDLLAALRSTATDLVLYTLGAESIDLERTVECIREAGKHVPIIAISSSHSKDIVECMLQGAEDLVYKDNLDHLKLVVYRTFKFQQQWRKLKKLEVSINETEKRCRTLLDSSRDSICYVHEGMHVYANDTYLNLLGHEDQDDIEGLPLMDLVASSDQQVIKEALRKLNKKNTGNDRLNIKLKHASGETFGAQLEFSPASIDGEKCTQIVIRNQNNARELEEQIKQLSQKDLTTGLYNRAYFIEQLEAAISLAAQGEQNCSLIQLQICNIQEIKGLVGPAATDTLINLAAKNLEMQSAEDEVLARFGEEAFAILTNHHGIGELKAHLDTLLSTLDKQTYELENKSITPKLCLGAIQIDENTPDINELLVRLENIVEQTRIKNDHGIGIYVPKEGEMTERQRDNLWKSKLKDALKNDRLKLVFQPIVSLQGDPGERYEIYTRLLDENDEEISADDFLPSAERTGTAKALDRWLIAHALNRLADILKSKPQTILFIKLTVGSLQDPQLLPWLDERLNKTKLPHNKLVFEIKEEVIITHLKPAMLLAKGLNKIHCKFAIDNFGTGLKPFQLMKAMPVEYLRIDRSLMQGINTNKENQETIRTINDTARSDGHKTIAPFVEDATALSILWGIGVNYIQGNFLREARENMDYDFSDMV